MVGGEMEILGRLMDNHVVFQYIRNIWNEGCGL
jgi:hypothetical protein